MDVTQFISALPKDEQDIAKRLRSLILQSDDRIEERLSYGVPYFYRYRRICFIWPASAPLGPKNCKVLFGFCYGNRLSNVQGLLLREDRKQVSLINFNSFREIGDEVLKEIIFEALIIDEQFKKKKK